MSPLPSSVILTDESGFPLAQSRELGLRVQFLPNATVGINGTVPVSIQVTEGVSPALPLDLPYDAFGRLRTSNPETLFDSKLTKDAQPLHWDDAEVSGTGTSTAWAAARSRISVGATTAGMRVRQTRRHFNYQAGKSQLIKMTFVFGAPAAGITRRVGQFDANNGLFLEQTSAGYFFVVRNATSDNRIPQSSWNGGRTDIPDPTKAQILVIDYEWLGVGTVRFGFQVPTGGIKWFHYAHHANSVTAVYMATPVNPLRYEISNDGTGAASSMDCICAEIESEGGMQHPGTHFTTDRGASPLVTLNDADLYPLLAVRLEAANMACWVRHFSIVCTSTALIRWALLLNPTVAGTALSFTPATNSYVGVAKATNATKVSGGTIINSQVVDFSNSPDTQVQEASELTRLGRSIAGVSDVLVLAVQRLTGTTETFYASMGWDEVY